MLLKYLPNNNLGLAGLALLPKSTGLCQQLPDPTIGCRLYYYVLADEDGGHAFAVTLEQHEANVQRALEAGLL